MTPGRGARPPAQHILAAHELAVVFTDRTGGRPKAGVRPVVAARPLPDIAKRLRERPVGWRLAQGQGMQRAAFQEVSRERRAARGHLPLGLGRQPFMGPTRKRLGLVEADMADGRVRVHGHVPVQRERAPAVVSTRPILGRLPAVGHDRVPAGGEPQFGPPVAAVVNKRHEIAVGHGVRRDLEGVEPDAVARHLVVKAESGVGMTDFMNCGIKRNPATPTRLDRGQGPLFLIRRLQRVARKQVLDIGQNQFLVLLLMVEPELDQGLDLGGQALPGQ